MDDEATAAQGVEPNSPRRPEYRPPRDRDAQASIRGYVYQVDTTIYRWLELGEREVLEPECGEDIDKVREVLGDQSRLLEQVKHRENNITIRSQPALESLAHAVEHIEHNPDQRLFFRFTTNASPGLEQPPRVGDARERAIPTWEGIRTGTISSTEAAEYLPRLQSMLRACNQPDGVPAPVWSSFQDYIASLERLEFLVSRFEWLYSAVSSSQVTEGLISTLCDRDDIKNRSHARVVYERLFLSVFKLLCQPRPRRLTAELLVTTIEGASSLSAEDERLLLELRKQWFELEARVAVLESGHAVLGERLSHVETGRLRSTLRSRLRRSPRPLPSSLSQRTESVTSLLESVDVKWLAIHGPAGLGKSTLAGLAATRFGGVSARLRLDGDGRNDEQLFAAALEDLAGEHDQLFEAAAEQLSAGPLLLDCLPRLAGSEPFSELLEDFVRALPEGQVRLISTSCYELPASLKRLSVRDVLAPQFTTTEAVELFTAYGADMRLGTREFELINTLCHGHGLLLEAAARFLRARGWALDEDALRDLLDGLHATDINGATVARLIESIRDAGSRDLAVRLKLVFGEASLRDVDALAAIPESIDRPRLRVRELEGMWLSPVGDATWFVSPLLRVLPDDLVQDETLAGCHGALATNFLAKGVLDFDDTRRALLHLRAAEDLERLGVVLAKAYLAVVNSASGGHAAAYVSLLDRFGVPQGLPLGFGIYVAVLRVLALERAGCETLEPLRDLLALVDDAGEEESQAVVVASSMLVWRYVRRYPTISLRLLRAGLSAERGRCDDTRGELKGPALASLLWFVGENCARDEDALASWIGAVEELDSGQRATFDADPNIVGASSVLVGAIWSAEAEKNANAQEWPRISRQLEELERSVSTFGLEVLAAACVCGRLLVLAEFQDDSAGAVTLGQQKLSSVTDPRARFLLSEYIGRVLVWAGRKVEAREVLDLCAATLEEFTDGSSYSLRSQSLRYRAEAWIDSDVPKATNSIVAAVQEAQTSLSVPVGELVRAHAEHATVLWLQGQKHEAYEPLSVAVERVLDRPADVEFKKLTTQLAHVTSYITSDVTRGVGPSKTADGSDYTPPHVGFFRSHFDADEIYRDDTPAALAAYLTLYAHVVGRVPEASSWAKRAIELAHQSRARSAFAPLATCANAYLLLDGLIEDVVEAAFLAGVVGSARAPAELLADARGWRPGERAAIYFGVLPATLAVGLAFVRDPGEGRELIQRLQQVCVDIGQRVGQARWARFATSLAECSGSAPLADAMQNAGALTQDQDEQIVYTCCLLLAGFHPEASVEWAAQAHLAAVPFFAAFVSHEETVRDLLFGPFVRAFWGNQLAERAALMSLPRLLGTAINEADRRADGNEVARLVMQGVSNAIRLA